ncbi:acyl-CoA synthetase [Sphingomonadaceae bacterium G21617-S1]|nr:acyl-CoA synthetase [Sphingomonadaceae bacterium G21617-S1]
MHPRDHAITTPDKPAYIMAGSGGVVTYKQLDERSNQGAHLLRATGLRAGDMVALFMHNSARFMEITWSAQRSGLYYIGVPTRLTATELNYLLRDSGAKALIYSADLEEVALAASRGLDNLARFSVDSSGLDREDFAAQRSAMPTTPITDESPGQDMLYSSGTTGAPKGIKRPRPEGAIDEPSPVTNLASALYGQDKNTIYLSPAPLYHAAPLRFCMAVHQLGGTDIIMEKFDPVQALDLIQKFQITHAQWVPTHFVRMLKLPQDVRERYDMSSLRCVYHAAAPCPIEIKRQMLEWWGPIVHEYYSSTELNGLTAATAAEWIDHPGTVGRSVIGEIKICDEHGEPVPPRTEGLVYFANGNPIEYHGDPEKTRQAYNQYGWTTVGDIGWVDEEGYLYLTDRQSFMIISGGVNIYPQEIENLLVSHPEVADVAVIGAPDPDMGERVVAVVQPVDPDADRAKLAETLQVYARANLSGYKIPRTIDFRDILPREPTGKLFKRLIRDEYRRAAQ